METLAAELVKLGIPGMIAAAALWWAVKKDRQLELLYKHWVRKTEHQTEKYHEYSVEHMAVLRDLVVAHQRFERILKAERNRHETTEPYRGPETDLTQRQAGEDPKDR